MWDGWGMLPSLLAGVREFRSAVVSGLILVFIVWLLWLRHLPGPGDATGLGADAFALVDYVGKPAALSVALIGVYLIGAVWMHLQEAWRLWIRAYTIAYIPLDGLVTRLRERNPPDFVLDHCIGPHSAFPTLFPQLGFRRPNTGELTEIQRDQLRRLLLRDLERSMSLALEGESALRGYYDRHIQEYRFKSTLALPSGLLAFSIASSFGGSWAFVGVLVGALVWYVLYRSALDCYIDALYMALEAANSGELGLPLTAEYGAREFGPLPTGYDPYSDGVASGAVLVEGRQG